MSWIAVAVMKILTNHPTNQMSPIAVMSNHLNNRGSLEAKEVKMPAEKKFHVRCVASKDNFQ